MPVLNPASRISVIIAAYNAASTLEAALESILQQSVLPREIIVVDDGSTDATRETAAGFKNRIRYLHQNNQGVSAARNHGVEHARGEWLAFLDADDFYYPHRIELYESALATHPQLDFIIGDYHYRASDGTLLRRSLEEHDFWQSLHEGGESFHLLAGKAIPDLIRHYFGHTLSFSVSKKRFLEAGGYGEGLRIGEDLHLVIRLCARSATVGVATQPVGAYVVHDSGLMRSDRLRAQEETVTTLLSLKTAISQANPDIRNAFADLLAQARTDLAIAHLKRGNRMPALSSALPLITDRPGWRAMRTILSIAKGL